MTLCLCCYTASKGSVYRLGSLRNMVYEERTLGRNVSIEVDLHDVRAGALEGDIRKKRHIVGITIGFHGELRGHGYDDLFAVRRKDLHVGFELPGTDPVVHDRKFQQSRRKDREENVFKQAHQRKL